MAPSSVYMPGPHRGQMLRSAATAPDGKCKTTEITGDTERLRSEIASSTKGFTPDPHCSTGTRGCLKPSRRLRI